MRWSRFYLFTTRDNPADAEVTSHQLMGRAGMLRKHAAGVYTYQPLLWRSIQKLMGIVRRELERIDCVELSMPTIQPAELWQESGRWSKYGKELLRMNDRHEREFCYGPTHEEIITDIVRRDVRSYRQLPISLYQIQSKFRDEIRPRFGLMRGREFLMKDAYSFHAGEESLDETYQKMREAYSRIIEACGLDYIVVDADSGSIGGSASNEFMVLAETGESAVVRCADSGYAANVEKATTRLDPPAPLPARDLEQVPTPGARTIQEVAKLLEVEPAQVVKTLVYDSDKGLVAVAIRGDRDVNEIKLANYLDAEWLELASDERVRKACGTSVGFVGPVGLPDEVTLLADESTRALEDWVCGANAPDAHLVGVNWGIDASPKDWVDVLLVKAGDPCPVSGQPLEGFRGIEVGHIFKLGPIYAEPMGCRYTDENGEEQVMEMGCYGLGIGRTLAAAIEQNHDDDGIIWPIPLAPFEVVLTALGGARDEHVVDVAEKIYQELLDSGVEVLYDDRDERPGVKFKDADLIGIPIRVTIGSRSLKQGGVEFSLRSAPREKQEVALGDVIGRVLEELGRSS